MRTTTLNDGTPTDRRLQGRRLLLGAAVAAALLAGCGDSTSSAQGSAATESDGPGEETGDTTRETRPDREPRRPPTTTTTEAPDEPDPLAGIAAGDCVSEAGTDMTEVPCTDGAAAQKVIAVSDTEPTCPPEADVTRTFKRIGTDGDSVTYGFCLATIVPAGSDGVLQVGSCLQLTEKGGDQLDIIEKECADPTATHTVTAGVDQGPCPEGTAKSFSKSDAEIAASGPASWCVAAR